MFYEPDKKNHGLPFQPYKSCVVPRPIGWISTMSRDGNVNLAPYSQFNNVGFDPGYLMFSAAGRLDDGHRKDSLVNAEETGEFVYNMATYDLRDAVSLTSDRFDFGINEMEMAGSDAGAIAFGKTAARAGIADQYRMQILHLSQPARADCDDEPYACHRPSRRSPRQGRVHHRGR